MSSITRRDGGLSGGSIDKTGIIRADGSQARHLKVSLGRLEETLKGVSKETTESISRLTGVRCDRFVI